MKTVRALYDYNGPEASSLSFKAGDFIKVISELGTCFFSLLYPKESGWWDGVCLGIRGWFPSNYVSKETFHTSSSWIKQHTPDGIPFYTHFENGQVAYCKPLAFSSPQLDTVSTHNRSSLSNSPLSDTTPSDNTLHPQWTKHSDTTPSDNTLHPQWSKHSDTTPSDNTVHPQWSKHSDTTPSDNTLHPQWSKNETPKGRVYFYNIHNDQTTWSAQEIDKTSGVLRATQSPAALVQFNNFSTPSSQLDSPFPKSPNNWASSATLITNSISNLCDATKLNQKQKYISLASRIVETIRHMFYASETAKADSVYMEKNTILKAHHHHVTSALSKLVLFSKSASSPSTSSTDDAIQIQNTAHELSTAIKYFIQTASSSGIPFTAMGSFTQPETLYSPSEILNPHNYHQKLYKSFETINKQIQVLEECIHSEVYSMHVIQRVKTLVTHVGAFFTLIDDILNHQSSFSNTPEALLSQFKLSRLSLFNNVSGLVMATQNSALETSHDVPMTLLLSTCDSVECSMREVFDGVQGLFGFWGKVDAGEKASDTDIKPTPESIESTQPLEGIDNTFLEKSDQPTQPLEGTLHSLSTLEQSIKPLEGMGQSSHASKGPGRAENSLEGIKQLTHLLEGIKQSTHLLEGIKPSTQPLESRKSTLPLHPIITKGLSTASMIHHQKTPSKEQEKINKIMWKKFGQLPTEISISPPLPKKEKEKPFYMQYDYDASDIVFDADGSIRSATIEVLIERLTLQDATDFEYQRRFLLTYKTFMTSNALFEALATRFSLEAPRHLNTEQVLLWHERKQFPIKSSIFQFLKLWIEQYMQNDTEDHQVLSKIRTFSDVIIRLESDGFANQLVSICDQRMSSPNVYFTKQVSSKNAPPPLLSKNFNYRKAKLVDIDPLEVARQVTLLVFSEFVHIKTTELMHKAWQLKDVGVSHVQKMQKLAHQITSWVSLCILNEKDIKKRVTVIKFFISVADKCKRLNNFDTLMAILSAFTSPPIIRLKRTWDNIPSKSTLILENLQKTMDHIRHYSHYRDLLRSVQTSCVPYLDYYLSHLSSIEDTLQNVIKNHIPFTKCIHIADLFQELLIFQNTPFSITPVEDLQLFLKNAMQGHVHDVMKLSYLLEPNEREDEKIARLLHESGFL